jgi:hypothetical protein
MTQNPYAGVPSPSPAGPQYQGDFIEPVHRRTSILAIFSLVVSIIGCVAFCIPGPGAVGVILGGLAVLFIARSAGRLTGMGLAITGIVLGLLSSLVVIWLWVGMGQAMSVVGGKLLQPIGSSMAALEKGDTKSARTIFSRNADTAITDKDLQDFTAAYQAELGHFQSAPNSLWSMITELMQIGPAMQHIQGGDQLIPIPLKFDKGSAVLGVYVDDGSPANGGPDMPPAFNLRIVTLDGKDIWLLDPKVADKIRTPGGRHHRGGGGSGTTPATTPGSGTTTTPAGGDVSPSPTEKPADATPTPATPPAQPAPATP